MIDANASKEAVKGVQQLLVRLGMLPAGGEDFALPLMSKHEIAEQLLALIQERYLAG